MVSLLGWPGLRTTASLGIAWLAVVLSGCQPATVASAPAETASLPAAVTPPAASATNTAIVKENAILIAEKLALLEVSASPLTPSALTVRLDIPERASLLRVELYGQAGQLLGRLLLAAPQAGPLSLQIPYEVSAPQTAILAASQQDARGRIVRQVSAEVTLQAGEGDSNLLAVHQSYAIEIEQAIQLASGAVQVSGRARLPANRGTLEIRLLNDENRILLSANRFIQEDGSFELELAGFVPQQEAAFLLTVVEQQQGVMIALDSVEIWLRP